MLKIVLIVFNIMVIEYDAGIPPCTLSKEKEITYADESADN